jgi:hypothetical protein
MNNQPIRSLVCLLLVAVAMAEAQSTKSQSSAIKSNATQKPKADPCTLLKNADIQAVQGETVQETKPSAQPGGGLVMSQCLFRTATPSKSVSIALATPSSISPRAFWLRQFHSGKSEADVEQHSTGAAKKAAVASKEEDESARPRPISGVGQEAYWVGGRMVGALYVLKGDTFFRISVGGIREESLRIQKSIALARAALKRI